MMPLDCGVLTWQLPELPEWVALYACAISRRELMLPDDIYTEDTLAWCGQGRQVRDVARRAVYGMSFSLWSLALRPFVK
jgi:hypothetical protein